MKKIAMILTLLFVLSFGIVAEAYSLPMSVTAYKYVTCYSSINGAKRGYIDKGDNVYITKIQGDWAYGSYPVNNGKSRAWRWFKFADVVKPGGSPSGNVSAKVNTLQNTYGYRSNDTYNGSGQCHGFAKKIASQIGTLASKGIEGSEMRSYIRNSLKIGDVVRLGAVYTSGRGHSFMVWKINGNKVYGVDANRKDYNKGARNRIGWDFVTDKNTLINGPTTKNGKLTSNTTNKYKGAYAVYKCTY